LFLFGRKLLVFFPPNGKNRASLFFEDASLMFELEVNLNFPCCICCQDVGVTLKCAGKGLARGANARASVKVPCPNCGMINRIIFAPDGTLYDVAPHEAPGIPEPSLN
jgi:hypothetical protein